MTIEQGAGRVISGFNRIAIKFIVWAVLILLGFALIGNLFLEDTGDQESPLPVEETEDGESDVEDA